MGAAGLWCVHMAVRPSLVQASPSETALTLQLAPQESYTGLIRRAEMAARAIAQRNFDSDILTSDVTVTVVGQNGEAVVPLLTLSVNRANWRNQPDPQRWSTYYPSAKLLLGLSAPSTPPGSPTATSAPAAPAPVAPDNAAASGNSPALTPAPFTGVGAPANAPLPATDRLTSPTPSSEPLLQPTPNRNPVQINLPAAPSGQLGLPRSILK